MKREEIIEEFAERLAEANSYGNDYGCSNQWYALAEVLGLDSDTVEAKCEELGYEPWDGVDFYDDDIEAWIRSVTDRNYYDIENETYDLTCEWEATSLVDEGYILNDRNQIVYANDEDPEALESLEKWEGSYQEWLDARATEAWGKNLKEQTGLDLTEKELEYLAEECNLGYYDEVPLEKACDLASSLHSIVCGAFGEILARDGSDYRLTEKSVEESYDSVEEAYDDLLKIVDRYSLKLRGCKVRNSEWEDIKGILANRELDCAILGVSCCCASRAEVAEFFVELFGMKHAVEEGIVDLSAVCETRIAGRDYYSGSTRVILWDVDELGSELSD